MIADTRLFVRSSGDGEPILLIHGFPLDASLWDDQLNYFASSYRVIAIDLPGFGGSHDASLQGLDDIAAYADAVADTINGLDLDGPVHVVGLSMGGYVGLEFWRRHRSRVRSLILCHTKASGDSSLAKQSRHAAARKAIEKGTPAAVDEVLAKLLSVQSEMRSPHLTQWLRETAHRIEPPAIAAAQRAMANRQDFRKLLGQIDVPTLAIAGTDDEIVSTEVMLEMSRAIPSSKFVAIHDAAHLSPREQPEQFNAAVDDFLATIASDGVA